MDESHSVSKCPSSIHILWWLVTEALDTPEARSQRVAAVAYGSVAGKESAQKTKKWSS